jgi:hypothetical protein
MSCGVRIGVWGRFPTRARGFEGVDATGEAGRAMSAMAHDERCAGEVIAGSGRGDGCDWRQAQPFSQRKPQSTDEATFGLEQPDVFNLR